MNPLLMNNVLSAVLFAVIGILIFVIFFVIIDWLTPYDLWNELVKEKNVALAIVVGSVSIGLCLIIAAAVHG